MKLELEQKAICEKYKVEFSPVGLGNQIWVGRNVMEEDLVPINGARQTPTEGESGWYIWAGAQQINEPNFFVTIDVADLDNWCPHALPYLALPAGYRFAIGEGDEDVWFDEGMV